MRQSLFIISIFLITSINTLCDSNCLECSEESICQQCSPNSILYNGTCLDQCPQGFIPKLEGNSYICEAAKKHFKFDGPIVFMPDYEIQDYSKQAYDAYYIYFPDEHYNVSVCFWLYLPGTVDFDTQYSVVTLTKNHGVNVNNSPGKYFSLKIDHEKLTFSSAQGKVGNDMFLPERRWSRTCATFNSYGQDWFSINEVDTSKHSYKNTFRLFPGYYILYIGGAPGANNFPGKITSFAFTPIVSTFQEAMNSFFLLDGIKEIDALWIFDYDDNEKKYITNFVTSGRLLLHKDNYIANKRLVFNDTASMFLRIPLNDRVKTIRFQRDFLFETNRLIEHKCGYLGIYNEKKEPIFSFNLEPGCKQTKYYYYEGSYKIFNKDLKSSNVFEAVSNSKEELISIFTLENDIVLYTSEKFYYDEEVSVMPESIWLVLGAQPLLNITQSCPFSIDNLMILYGSLGQYDNYVHNPQKGDCILRDKETGYCTKFFEHSTEFGTFLPGEECPENCTSCEGNFCLKCKTGYMLHGNCVPTCPAGYDISSDGSCNFISVFCSESGCLTCQNGYHKNSQGICVKDCPSYSYEKWNSTTIKFDCIACSAQDCKSCPDDQCNECKEGLFLYRGTCIKKCPPNAQLSPNGRECLDCPPGCKSCLRDGTCVECNPGNFLIVDQSICVPLCPRGYTASDDVCLRCPSGCVRCFDSNKCHECEIGLYQYQGKCHKECPKEAPLMHQGYCASKCPDFMFADPSNNCMPCPNYCERCTDERTCLEYSDLLIEGSYPLFECPKGYFSVDERNCMPCSVIKNCEDCISGAECFQCKNNFLLFEGQCLESCPEKAPFIWNGICYSDCPEGSQAINGKCIEMEL